MKTGIEETYYKRFYGDDYFEKLIEDGFDCIDYQGFINVNTPFFKLPFEKFKAELIKTRELARKAGVEISQTHAPWAWPPCDETDEQKKRLSEDIVKSIKGTALLGCKYMAVHTICCHIKPEIENFVEQNVEFFKPLTETAKEYGVTLCLENLPFTYINETEHTGTMKIAELVGNGMEICLDTGHSMVWKIQPAEAVRYFGSHLKILHVHDNNGVGDFHGLPYTGKIDWDDFCAALKEVGYKGCMSIETGPCAAYPDKIYEMVLKVVSESARSLASKCE